MKLETILDAMCKALILWEDEGYIRHIRQYHTFRNQILKMFAIGRSKNADLNTEIEMIEAGYTGLQYEMNKQLAEKDERIAELEVESQRVRNHLFADHYCNCESWDQDD